MTTFSIKKTTALQRFRIYVIDRCFRISNDAENTARNVLISDTYILLPIRSE